MPTKIIVECFIIQNKTIARILGFCVVNLQGMHPVVLAYSTCLFNHHNTTPLIAI
jgi:hypothetical protein